MKKLIVDDKEIKDKTHIIEYTRKFYETLFKKRKWKIAAEIKYFSRHLNIPKLPEDKSKLCGEEKDLDDSLKSMKNDKSPGNDGLTKEFYETFWNELKEIFGDSVLEAKGKGHSLRAIIEIKEKKTQIRDT